MSACASVLRMESVPPLQGDLQIRVMQTLWKLGTAGVEEVRLALPAGSRGAYTTVQTVLNRLTDRGLLARERRGKRMEYRPQITEAEYVSRALQHALGSASSDARQAALAELIGGLERSELSDIRRRARSIEIRRKSR